MSTIFAHCVPLPAAGAPAIITRSGWPGCPVTATAASARRSLRAGRVQAPVLQGTRISRSCAPVHGQRVCRIRGRIGFLSHFGPCRLTLTFARSHAGAYPANLSGCINGLTGHRLGGVASILTHGALELALPAFKATTAESTREEERKLSSCRASSRLAPAWQAAAVGAPAVAIIINFFFRV